MSEPNERFAFTLIELLVVLLVLAILVLISLPAISRARASARKTQCLSNLHQIGVNGFTSGRLFMFCPDDPTSNARREANGTSYVLNKDIMDEKNMALSKTIKGFEAANDYRRKLVSPSVWFSNDRTANWTMLQDEIAPQRHFETLANYLYADGHAASIPADQIRAWANDGMNFGLPNNGEYNP